MTSSPSVAWETDTCGLRLWAPAGTAGELSLATVAMLPVEKQEWSRTAFARVRSGTVNISIKTTEQSHMLNSRRLKVEGTGSSGILPS